ncbi:30S ribosomal protein S11 [Candidatus Nomurabacteria bacterium RIFCSPLOWO2_12_FULL_46_14]|uniref:Small ribosomal subunit protein uS11 n=1 Tax=Candidatus Nomurabacteria bacterium RIFCSPLOWO2_12_FULL_46_14 TaxID=1801797 RepID=A0A1F6Y952_9BACT|nr:MAG: 30S ribosomal protein S11 [Candidatus Nomurabacteria bacterium RIFCSPLOWO2_12_FULL_46_14]
MGKTKIIKEPNTDVSGEVKVTPTKSPKKKVTSGIIYVNATFNNTRVLFTDKLGNALFAGSSGALGFKGAKKGTPFAASKVGDILGARAAGMGVKDSDVIIKGVGSGREPAVRAFMAHGIEITSIKDATPVPHNGPKPKKRRRV